MVLLATTVEASRSFSDGVVVTWQPTMTDNTVTVQITIGGELVWSDVFYGDDSENVDTAGDDWTIAGQLSTVFQADGIHGQLVGTLTWEVGGNSHYYKGLIGLW
jgi:hypothetical protein